MKCIEAEDGYVIKVGDTVLRKGPLDAGYHVYKVHRVTDKFAFIRYNDVAEGKLPRIYSRFSFHSLPRQKWSQTDYKVVFPQPEQKVRNYE